MWLEHLARASGDVDGYPFPLEHGELDYRPLLRAVIADRVSGRDGAEIARAFHRAVATAVIAIAGCFSNERLVASGGVFQNALLVDLLAAEFGERMWFNAKVPANDGGLSLGQAAIAACQQGRSVPCFMNQR
jgi:hydrogenase maturation protein HypF